ncbi:MAG: hypothetical protein RL175_976 [Pseudomonadota bacterium]
MFKRVLLMCACVMALLGAAMSVAQAETPVALQAFKLERQDGAVYLSGDWQFDMANTLEDALLKGITLYFVTEVEVRQERWYFYNQRVARAERHVRVFYQPLTRRWRVNVSPQPFNAGGLGMSLGQSYDTAEEAMNAVRRISPWRIANLADVNMDAKPSISINFKLDLTQLPRPLQIGAANHSEWNLVFNKTQRMELTP